MWAHVSRTTCVNKIAADEIWHMNGDAWLWHMQRAASTRFHICVCMCAFAASRSHTLALPIVLQGAPSMATITTVLNCQQLRFYCAKMHLCIFLMAQFRTKINDIRKNNIACQPPLPLLSPLPVTGSPCCKKTNNCGNCRITFVDWPDRQPSLPAHPKELTAHMVVQGCACVCVGNISTGKCWKLTLNFVRMDAADNRVCCTTITASASTCHNVIAIFRGPASAALVLNLMPRQTYEA